MFTSTHMYRVVYYRAYEDKLEDSEGGVDTVTSSGEGARALRKQSAAAGFRKSTPPQIRQLDLYYY